MLTPLVPEPAHVDVYISRVLPPPGLYVIPLAAIIGESKAEEAVLCRVLLAMSAGAAPAGYGAHDTKPERVLACTLCQQRKVKCPRKFPCSNCIKLGAACVPAGLVPRPRKRRFAERELLDRCRRYEDLLRQNSIQFEPLHPSQNQHQDHDGGDIRGIPSNHESPGNRGHIPTRPRTYEAKNIWHAMSQGDPDEETDVSDSDVHEEEFKNAWDRLYEHRPNGRGLDYILTASGNGKLTDLSSLHPDAAKVFRLWQTYLDNVNPLLKVTHTPTLQGRLIEAISDFTKIKPAMEALMFSIYSVAVYSLVESDCQAMFGSTKEHLATMYQLGCEQALLNCNFLSTNDRDCLTAVFLYLISFGLGRDPKCLSSVLGVAIRIGQRLGLDSEAANAKCSVFEAEMRRRLWWALVVWDARLGELADFQPVALSPVWDCKIPLNVGDFDLRHDSMEPPDMRHSTTSETVFAVMRSEMGDFLRRAAFFLDFTAPALKTMVGSTGGTDTDRLVVLERMLEARYLRICDPGNPLHFMTIWTARSNLARYKLVEHYSRDQPTEADRNEAFMHALTILDCDTAIMSSILTRGFRWFANFHFPFPAYLHIIHELKRRPVSEQANRAWDTMSINFEARFPNDYNLTADNPLFEVFAKTVLQAWKSCLKSRPDSNVEKPRIVELLLIRLELAGSRANSTAETGAAAVVGLQPDLARLQPSSELLDPSVSFNGTSFADSLGSFPEPGFSEPPVLNLDDSEMNWAAFGWSLGMRHGW